MNKKTILFIHQSSELYGSDKTLFYLAREVNNNSKFKAIVVIPDDGPLKGLLEENNIEVIISPIVKVSRKMFTLINLLLLPFTIVSSVQKLNKALKEKKIDVVHSNTMAVLVGAFYCKFYKIKHVWHIHEIIEKPKFVKKYFPKLVRIFSDYVVYNSDATKDFFCNEDKYLSKKSITILNGLDRDCGITSANEVKSIRKDLFIVNDEDLVIALVGRINKWKGHNLLLNAFNDLNKKYNNIKLIFVGSAPPGQEFFIDNLEEQIQEHDLENKCKIIPFQNNIWKIWDSIDIAAVPSTEPEPFGLVAIEAMLANKPVVAANHGGIKEIVVHNNTGFLFEPNNTKSLRSFLEILITDKTKFKEFGEKGKIRAKEKFSLNTYADKFVTLYSDI